MPDIETWNDQVQTLGYRSVGPVNKSWDTRTRSSQVAKIDFLTDDVCEGCEKTARDMSFGMKGRKTTCYLCDSTLQSRSLNDEDENILEFFLGDAETIQPPRFVQSISFESAMWSTEQIEDFLKQYGLSVREVDHREDAVFVDVLGDDVETVRRTDVAYRLPKGVTLFTREIKEAG